MATKFSKEKELEIVKLYVEKGLNQKEIASIYNTWNTSIRRVLLRYNVTPKSVSEQTAQIKTNPFIDLTNPEVQYWLGYMAADGNVKPVTNKSNLIRINSNLDPKHLEKYASFLGYGKTVRQDLNKRTGNYEYCVGFCNKAVNKYLHSLGITANKSNSLKMNIELTKPFVLGYIDGNGTITKYTVQICTGSEYFATQLVDFFERNYSVTSRVRKHSQSNAFLVTFSKIETIKKIMNGLYNSSPVYLDRKYQKFHNLYSSL